MAAGFGSQDKVKKLSMLGKPRGKEKLDEHCSMWDKGGHPDEESWTTHPEPVPEWLQEM